MNENTKTFAFIGVAAALLLGAWALQPRIDASETESEANTKFFPEFTDPAKAAAMEIMDFDPLTGPRVFKVSQINDVWSIPSHENYPADGKDHLAQAAASVIDLTRLDKVTDSAADHEMLGVIEPDGKLLPGATGVGKRVTLEDKAGNKLAQFIIGNEVKDRPELRYVRMPGDDKVYMVAVKTDKLSTKFQNWIEEDLLKLTGFDIKQISIDDHSVDELRGSLVQRGRATVDYDNKDSKWTLVDDQTFNPKTNKWSDVKLGEDEELNATKLNEMKTALDDLKIVDVLHKPSGLSADLRGGEDLTLSEGTMRALARRGFFLATNREGTTYEIFSNEGEVRCGTIDGVEYILRFGGVAGSGHDEDEEDKEKKSDETDPAKSAATKDAGVDRYLMVTTHFRQDLIPPADEQPLPEVPGGVEDADAPAADQPADAKPGDAKPADAKPATGPAAPPKESSDSRATGAASATLVAYQAPKGSKQPAARAPGQKAAPAAKPAPAKAPATKAAAKADETKAAAPAPEAKADVPLDPDAAAAAADKARREALAAYKRISEENKRKREDYDKKVESGKKRVEDLNARFADWYYVISDKTYDKIHISRDQLIQKKGAKDAEHDHEGHDHALPPDFPPGLIPGGTK